MSMLRKMSIVPVALVAMYLFACKSGDILIQTEMKPTMAVADNGSNTVSKANYEEVLYAIVDEKPLFNGEDAETTFREWAYTKVVYPPAAQENGIQGRVFVEFAIDGDGSVTNVRLLRGADPLLDNEALRIINSSPKWTPGKHGGKQVSVLYQFQFVFRLNNGNTQTTPSSSNVKPSEESKPVGEVVVIGFGSQIKTSVVPKPASDEETILYDKVEVKPLFNGKEAETAFREWAYTKVVYPSESQKNGITGRVFVEFIIDKDGSVTNVKLLRGVDPLLDAEALRVVSSSPKWTPGKQDGKTVSVKYQFQLVFRLRDESTQPTLSEKEVELLKEYPKIEQAVVVGFGAQKKESVVSKTVSESSGANDEEIFLFANVKEKPLFNGKDAETAFREWVFSKIVYPPKAQEKGIQGHVFVEFAIDKDGSVTDVKLLRGADPLLDNETLRVINLSPKWMPGKHDGKTVKVLYQFHMVFRMND